MTEGVQIRRSILTPAAPTSRPPFHLVAFEKACPGTLWKSLEWRDYWEPERRVWEPKAVFPVQLMWGAYGEAAGSSPLPAQQE